MVGKIEYSNTKVLVTGGSGFIGSNLISYLLKQAYLVNNFDIKFPRIKEHVSLYKRIDLLDYDQLKAEIFNFMPDIVVHLAARTDLGGKTIKDYEVNTKGTDNLCKILSENAKIKRLIIASSMLVCEPGYRPKSKFDYMPINAYGESKVETERISLSYVDLIPKMTIIRPTSIWGPWFGKPYCDFFNLILNNMYFHITTNMANKTMGYVSNTVQQIISIFNSKENLESIYYLGDTVPINIMKWANMIAELGGRKRPITVPFAFVKFLAFIGDTMEKLGLNFPMNSYRLRNMSVDNVYDVTSIEALNVFPKIGLEQGVLETLDWMRNIDLCKDENAAKN